jgi:hypothetical protein
LDSIKIGFSEKDIKKYNLMRIEECANFLINKGANVNYINPAYPNVNAFSLATEVGNHKLAKIILDAHFNPHLPVDKDGSNAFSLAVRAGWSDFAERFADEGVDINAEPLLVEAIANLSNTKVQFLLSLRGIDHEKRATKGKYANLSPLFVAIKVGNFQAFQWLWERANYAADQSLIDFASQHQSKGAMQQKIYALLKPKTKTPGVDALVNEKFSIRIASKLLNQVHHQSEQEAYVQFSRADANRLTMTLQFFDAKNTLKTLSLFVEPREEGGVLQQLIPKSGTVKNSNNVYYNDTKSHVKKKVKGVEKWIRNSNIASYVGPIFVNVEGDAIKGLKGSYNYQKTEIVSESLTFDWRLNPAKTELPEKMVVKSHGPVAAKTNSAAPVTLKNVAEVDYPLCTLLPGRYRVMLGDEEYGIARLPLFTLTDDVTIIDFQIFLRDGRIDNKQLFIRINANPRQQCTSISPVHMHQRGYKFLKDKTTFNNTFDLAPANSKGSPLRFSDVFRLAPVDATKPISMIASTTKEKSMQLIKISDDVGAFHQDVNEANEQEVQNEEVLVTEEDFLDDAPRVHDDHAPEPIIELMHNAPLTPTLSAPAKQRKRPFTDEYVDFSSLKGLGISKEQQDRTRRRLAQTKNLYKSGDDEDTKFAAVAKPKKALKKKIPTPLTHEVHPVNFLNPFSLYEDCSLYGEDLETSTWFAKGYSLQNKELIPIKNRLVIGTRNWEKGATNISRGAAWGKFMATELGNANHYGLTNVHISSHKQENGEYLNINHDGMRFEIQKHVDGDYRLYRLNQQGDQEVYIAKPWQTVMQQKAYRNLSLQEAARLFIGWQPEWHKELSDLDKAAELQKNATMIEQLLVDTQAKLFFSKDEWSFNLAWTDNFSTGLLMVNDTEMFVVDCDILVINQNTASIGIHFNNFGIPVHVAVKINYDLDRKSISVKKE